MHINKMMIIKVATDATVAITITTFLSSSGEFILNGLSEPILVAFTEGAETLIDVNVEGPVIVVFSVFAAAIVVVVFIAAVIVVVLADVLGVCLVGANRAIGS